MNNRFLLALVLLGAQIAFAGDDTKTCTLNVKGMTCGACAARVENAVSRLQGVQAVNVSLESGTAEVTYLPARLTSSDLLASIDRSGFTASVANEPQDQKTGKNMEQMKGGMQMEMPMNPEMDQARGQLKAAKLKPAPGGHQK